MSYYIANGTFYAVPQQSDELYHYGVKGMKWGQRKRYEPIGGMGRRSSGAYTNMNGAGASRQQVRQHISQTKTSQQNAADAQAKRAARIEKAKKAAKIGAAVAGTALAAYGTYKLAKFVQQKRSAAAMQKAQDFIDNNVLRQVGKTTFTDGTHQMSFETRSGSHKMTTQGARNVVGKAAGQHNAKIVAQGRQMYKDTTNTKFDRGLAKVVNAGDAVGNAAKRAGNAAKTTAKNVKNRVLDTVKPIYEYTPTGTNTRTWRDSAGMDWTETVTNYAKTKKRRT